LPFGYAAAYRFGPAFPIYGALLRFGYADAARGRYRRCYRYPLFHLLPATHPFITAACGCAFAFTDYCLLIHVRFTAPLVPPLPFWRCLRFLRCLRCRLLLRVYLHLPGCSCLHTRNACYRGFWCVTVMPADYCICCCLFAVITARCGLPAVTDYYAFTLILVVLPLHTYVSAATAYSRYPRYTHRCFTCLTFVPHCCRYNCTYTFDCLDYRVTCLAEREFHPLFYRFMPLRYRLLPFCLFCCVAALLLRFIPYYLRFVRDLPHVYAFTALRFAILPVTGL